MKGDDVSSAADRVEPGERRREKDGSGEPNTDIAALGGGVVAIAMTIFGDDGPYDLFGLAIAITLLLLIFGYVLPHERWGWKRIAIAAVVGLVCTPATGYYFERNGGPWTDCDEWNYRIAWDQANRSPPFDLRPLQCDNELSIQQARLRIIQGRGQEPPNSTVSEKATLGAWFLLALLFWALDFLYAWTQKRPSAESAISKDGSKTYRGP